MPKYLDSDGVAYLWKKIKNNFNNKMIYYSKRKADWDLDRNLISQKNVLYIYLDYKNINKNGEQIFIPGLKVGDGTTYLIDLPFVNDFNNGEIEQQILNHINNTTIHVLAEEKEFWNNKLNLSLQSESQTLVFNRY